MSRAIKILAAIPLIPLAMLIGAFLFPIMLLHECWATDTWIWQT